MAVVDVEPLRKLVEEGYLTCRQHPSGADLFIWNYTDKTMYSRNWTSETRMCRGLITTREGLVVARPFQKFFNYGERPDDEMQVPNEPFKVTRKADGSLGVLYHLDGLPCIATRGSFKSEQALHATRVLHERYGDYPFNPNFTYLFEIVYPANRYVVNYGEMDDLILLAMIHTDSGIELDVHMPSWKRYPFPFPVIEEYSSGTSLADLRALLQIQEDDQEGFVLRFESGHRLKIKFDEYKRIFRILCHTSNRSIWEALKAGTSLAEIYDRVPPEFESWARKVSRDLSREYERIHRRVNEVYKEITQSTMVEIPPHLMGICTVVQFKALEKRMKHVITRRFKEYPDIEPFLFHKWEPSLYYFHDDGRVERGKDAARRLFIWDSLEPVYSRPYIVDGEEKEIAAHEEEEEQEAVTVWPRR